MPRQVSGQWLTCDDIRDQGLEYDFDGSAPTSMKLARRSDDPNTGSRNYSDYETVKKDCLERQDI